MLSININLNDLKKKNIIPKKISHEPVNLIDLSEVLTVMVVHGNFSPCSDKLETVRNRTTVGTLAICVRVT